jgi:hypothetical protein
MPPPEPSLDKVAQDHVPDKTGKVESARGATGFDSREEVQAAAGQMHPDRLRQLSLHDNDPRVDLPMGPPRRGSSTWDRRDSENTADVRSTTGSNRSQSSRYDRRGSIRSLEDSAPSTGESRRLSVEDGHQWSRPMESNNRGKGRGKGRGRGRGNWGWNERDDTLSRNPLGGRGRGRGFDNRVV